MEEYKATAGNFKHTLERIKRNLEDGVCCKCYCEPEGDRFILQCCNVLLCESCILRYNTHTFIERCPSCVKKILSLSSAGLFSYILIMPDKLLTII